MAARGEADSCVKRKGQTQKGKVCETLCKRRDKTRARDGRDDEQGALAKTMSKGGGFGLGDGERDRMRGFCFGGEAGGGEGKMGCSGVSGGDASGGRLCAVVGRGRE